MTMIAVVGATGTIGSRLVGALANAGAPVRAIARHPGEPRDEVETVSADLTDLDAALAALDGATAVYLTPPLAGQDPTGLERTVCHNVIDAATKHGVDHVVMHSAVHADRGDTGARILDNKTPIEEALATSGVGYTILRPAWFLQNLWLARDYLEQGVASMPWDAEMVWAATDINDIVDAAVGFLDQGPANRGFDIHVPGGITGRTIAQAATKVLGRQVAYQPAGVPTRDFVESFPISDVHKQLYAELFDYFRSTTYLGDPQPFNDALAGFQPRGVEHFLRHELFASA